MIKYNGRVLDTEHITTAWKEMITKHNRDAIILPFWNESMFIALQKFLFTLPKCRGWYESKLKILEAPYVMGSHSYLTTPRNTKRAYIELRSDKKMTIATTPNCYDVRIMERAGCRDYLYLRNAWRRKND